MTDLSQIETLKKEWVGFYENNCLPLDNELRNNVFQPPVNVDWSVDLLAITTQEQAIYKRLRLGKLYYLEHDIESEPNELGEYPLLDGEGRLLINVKVYQYGQFKGLLPEYRKPTMMGVFRQSHESDLELKAIRILPNELTTKAKINQVAIGRRTDAKDYIETRAIEIDALVPGAYNLESKIQDFFRENLNEMLLFYETGAADIIDKIQAVLDGADDHWLKVPIPTMLDEQGNPVFRITGEEIMRVFKESISSISPLEIATFWSLFNQNDFTAPVTEQVAIAVDEIITSNLQAYMTAQNFQAEFDTFKAKYLTNQVDLDGIMAIAPLPAEDPEQQNWLFTSIPGTGELLSGLSDENKQAIGIDLAATEITFMELLKTVFFVTE